MDVGRRVDRISRRLPKHKQRSMVPQPLIESCTYSVLDVETTGLSNDDRILEIAVVRFTGDGKASDRWSTLVNPGRDTGAFHIHQVNRFSYVRHAPQFRDIAGDLSARLAGTVIAAHNVTFEERFLRSEFLRLGHRLPDFPKICTLSLALACGAKARRLGDLCAQFGIPLPRAHTALGDAEATSMLLAGYLTLFRAQGARTIGQVGCTVSMPAVGDWPAIPRTGQFLEREAAQQLDDDAGTDSLLPRVAARLARPNGPDAMYLDLLDRILEDYRITLKEAEVLQECAAELGLGDRTMDIHLSYLEEVIRLAWDDHVVTPGERREINLLGQLLGFSEAEIEALVRNCAPAEGR